MKKLLFSFIVFLISLSNYSQETTVTNLKDITDPIVQHEMNKGKQIKIYLNDKEVEDVSKHNVDYRNLILKIQKIESSDKKEQLIEVRITANEIWEN